MITRSESREIEPILTRGDAQIAFLIRAVSSGRGGLQIDHELASSAAAREDHPGVAHLRICAA
jgi:hypothetical protein